MHQHRVEKVLMVNDSFKLKGMITVKDFQKAEQNQMRVKMNLVVYVLVLRLAQVLAMKNVLMH